MPVIRDGLDPVKDNETEVDWPMIVGREWHFETKPIEIEPGESDTLDADFVIYTNVTTIQLYAYVGNPTKAKPNLGWTNTLVHSFGT